MVLSCQVGLFPHMPASRGGLFQLTILARGCSPQYVYQKNASSAGLSVTEQCRSIVDICTGEIKYLVTLVAFLKVASLYHCVSPSRKRK